MIRSACSREDGVAGEGRACQQDNEGQVGGGETVPAGGDQRRDEAALAVADEADAPAVDLGAAGQEGGGGRGVAGKVTGGG
jgi:hypothetical protein